MVIERKLIISLLKLTKKGSISSHIVAKDAKIPSEDVKEFNGKNGKTRAHLCAQQNCRRG